jgi:hypothetical protein
MVKRIRVLAEAHSTGLFEDIGAPVRRAATSISDSTWRDLQQWVEDYDYILPLTVEEQGRLRAEIDVLDRRGMELLKRIRAEWPQDLLTGEKLFFQYYSEGLMRSLGKIDSANVAFAPVRAASVGGFRFDEGIPLWSFPPPAAVLIEPLDEGGVLLTRLTAEGKPAGDTLHESAAEAREQAFSEYRSRLGPWRPVPESRKDREAYVAEQVGPARPGPSDPSSGG